MAIDSNADTTKSEPEAEFRALSPEHFKTLCRVGDGSFASVFLCAHKETQQRYAIKMINRNRAVRHNLLGYIKNECKILDELDYVGVAKLHFTTEDDHFVYMGLEYCSGGDLDNQLAQQQRMTVESTRFYAAEIVLTLAYLRSKKVIHRDLKPENLLLTESGHIRLADFGSAKGFFLPPELARNSKNRATSFVGTADYISPEVLSNTGISYSADLWALGCIIFQMLSGHVPFLAANDHLTFQLVTACEYSYPDDFPADAKDLIDKLLVLEPTDRLGAGATSFEDLKAHPFFSGVDWDNIWNEDAPAFARPAAPNSEDFGLNWELTSLTKGEPVKYAEVKS